MFGFKRFFQTHFCPYWKTFVVILTPILLLPLPLAVHGTVRVQAGLEIIEPKMKRINQFRKQEPDMVSYL